MLKLTRLGVLMDELNDSYRREDFANMVNIILLELLDLLKELAADEAESK